MRDYSKKFIAISTQVEQFAPYLTPVASIYDEKCDTNHWLARAMNTNLSSENEPNQPFRGFIGSDEEFNELVARASEISISCKAEEYLETKALKKWTAPQGGRQSLQLCLTALANYALNSDDLHLDTSLLSFDKLPTLQHIDSAYIESASSLYKTYKKTHASSGGYTWGADRRNPKAIAQALRNAHSSSVTADPVILGSRLKDTKTRTIFMDSLDNYFRYSRFMHNLFEAWKPFPGNHATSDRNLEIKIASSAMGTELCAYCGDYEGMDMHMSLGACLLSIDVLAKMTSLDAAQAARVKADFTSMWNSQRIVIGSRTYEFEHHALFSGIYPTHDLESPLNYAILTTVIDELGYAVDHTWCRKAWQVRILVNGDDSAVLFNKRALDIDDWDAFLKRVAEKHRDVSHRIGQIVNVEKVETSHDYVPFCKRLYGFKPGPYWKSRKELGTLDVPYSKYSMCKALNALYHPENMPRFESEYGFALWFCTILDCSYGMSSWNNIVSYLVNRSSEETLERFRNYSSITYSEQDVELMNRDYWFRMYGMPSGTPCIQESETYKLVVRLLSERSK